MTLHIYNTLGKKKELFHPLEEGAVRMYVCGPTVYDYIHIGNARPLIFFDVVRRYLEYARYNVTYVVNFTDVDDKLIRKSEQTGMTVAELADKFIGHYYEDARGLGVRDADVHPRVTDNMEEIIAFIGGLIERGYAYFNEGDVFFRTGHFDEYGKLSGQNTEELQFGLRIEVDRRKEDERDFVLWKAAKPGEVSWTSPWGEGRPGWHIECSAMAGKYLGNTLDIHGGGHDLQFPHHECEIAQSEALTGEPLARYWMHNGYIHIDNEKMSKSLGNGITVRELLKLYPTGAVRFFMLSTHYRNPLNFSEEALTSAVQAVDKIKMCAANLRHRLEVAAAEGEGAGDSEYVGKLEQARRLFVAKMDDDFNTPDAISAVFEWVAATNKLLAEPEAGREALQRGERLLDEWNGVLGLLEPPEELLPDADIDSLIAERQQARKDKNWARADEIRDELAQQGIVLEDTPQGIRWRRK